MKIAINAPPANSAPDLDAKNAGQRQNADDPKEARLNFLCAILMELRELAAEIDEKTLAYLVGMAALEAGESARVHKYRSELQPENDQ